MVDLEERGIPSVYAASAEFEQAGAVQAQALGFDPAAVFVPHPIQDRTEDEIRALARQAATDLIRALSSFNA